MKKLFLGLLLAVASLAGGVDAQVHTNGASLGGRALAQRVPTAFILCKSAVVSAAPADTSEDTLFTCAIPAASMGANGGLRITTVWSWTNSGNTKTPRIRYSGPSGTQLLNAGATTTAGFAHQVLVWNRNATNSQVAFPNNTSSYASSSNAPTTAAVDTTAATSVVATCQKASAGETCQLDMLLVELLSDGT